MNVKFISGNTALKGCCECRQSVLFRLEPATSVRYDSGLRQSCFGEKAKEKHKNQECSFHLSIEYTALQRYAFYNNKRLELIQANVKWLMHPISSRR